MEIGPFELNSATRELLLRGQLVDLQPRVFDVIEFLALNHHRVVGKEELLNTLWPDVIVTDASLQRAVSLARTALRTGGLDEVIETRARHGYRFRLPGAGANSSAASGTPANLVESEDKPRLIERDEQLAELRLRWKSAGEGHGQAVFISGEAGIGKSALVDLFLRELQGNARILRGYCDALFTPRAFGAILDLTGQIPEAGSLVGAGLSREEMFAGLRQHLSGENGSLVVVLEDLHWADEATLDFVRYFVRRLGNLHCLLLATYREEDHGPLRLLRQMLGELGARHFSRLPLPPLSSAAMGALAARYRQDRDELVRLTGGNPFLVHELLTAPSKDVPENVRDSMIARLSRCSSLARAVCEAVAIMPGRAEWALVLQLAGPGTDAIEEAMARGVIRHESGCLLFNHELARRAVENLLTPARTRELHLRTLACLRERKADFARLVHHARCGGDREAVFLLAPEAARQALRVGAHREAAAHYATAIAFADELSARQKVELLELHAYECYLTSQIDKAVESLLEALELWRGLGDRNAEGRTLRFLSRQYWFLGDRARGERYAKEAITMLEPLGRGRELAMAYSNQSQLDMLKGDQAGAVAFGEKAVALARELREVEIESHALNNIGAARLLDGEASGVVDLERSLALALANNFHEHAARAYVNLGTSLRRQRVPQQARKYLTEGLAYCEERDLDSWTLYLKAQQAGFEMEQGRWEPAQELARNVLKSPAATAITKIPALVALGQYLVRTGETEADEVLKEALALALPTAEVQRIGPVAAVRAESAWLAGDRDAVLKEVAMGLPWALEGRDAWIAGELLFWKSRVQAVTDVPAWISEPYRHLLRGNWKRSAQAFADLEMPYERALALTQGNPAAVRLAEEELTKLDAKRTLARLKAS